MKKIYSELFSEITTSEQHGFSFQKLSFFVDLILIDEKNSEQVIEYDEIFQIVGSGSSIAFVGEAGVGKTTLLSKIAFDWATGTRLNHIKLLFLVALREVKDERSFYEILLRYFPHDSPYDIRNALQRYIKTKNKKVMFLFDGLDEFTDITNLHPDYSAKDIIKGDMYPGTTVIFTSRKGRAEQITSVEGITDRYARIRVKGFNEETSRDFIERFFKSDWKAAKNLLRLIRESTLAAKNLMSYPFFCRLFCYMWRDKTQRDKMPNVETFSQLFEEMVHYLLEKLNENEKKKDNPSEDCQSEQRDDFKKMGKLALSGLQKGQLEFEITAFHECGKTVDLCCDVNILTKEKRIPPEKQNGVKEHVTISFTHKLFQEYMAGLYFASLHQDSKDDFRKTLDTKLGPNYEEFRHLLYFTGANGKQTGNTGKTLLDTLCSKVKNESFIIDVAFESHYIEALPSVIDLLKEKTLVELIWSTHQNDAHTWSAYEYTFGAVGKYRVGIYNY